MTQLGKAKEQERYKRRRRKSGDVTVRRRGDGKAPGGGVRKESKTVREDGEVRRGAAEKTQGEDEKDKVPARKGVCQNSNVAGQYERHLTTKQHTT